MLDRGYRPEKTGETVDRGQNNGSVKAVYPRHCPATSALAVAVSTAVLGSHKDNVRCTAVEEQLEAQLHLLAHDLFWAELKVQLHLPPLDLTWNTQLCVWPNLPHPVGR